MRFINKDIIKLVINAGFCNRLDEECKRVDSIMSIFVILPIIGNIYYVYKCISFYVKRFPTSMPFSSCSIISRKIILYFNDDFRSSLPE